MKTGKKGREGFEFKVSFRVDEKMMEIDIHEKLNIPSIDTLTPSKIANLMAENPAIHARWNVLSNNAAIEYDHSKIEFEIWVKEQAKTYREELADTTKKRVTDKMVEEAVMTDPEYKKLYRKMLEKKRDAANLKSVAIGFDKKGERLVNISSLLKSERPRATASSSSKDEDDDISAFSDDK